MFTFLLCSAIHISALPLDAVLTNYTTAEPSATPQQDETCVTVTDQEPHPAIKHLRQLRTELDAQRNQPNIPCFHRDAVHTSASSRPVISIALLVGDSIPDTTARTSFDALESCRVVVIPTPRPENPQPDEYDPATVLRTAALASLQVHPPSLTTTLDIDPSSSSTSPHSSSQHSQLTTAFTTAISANGRVFLSTEMETMQTAVAAVFSIFCNDLTLLRAVLCWFTDTTTMQKLGINGETATTLASAIFDQCESTQQLSDGQQDDASPTVPSLLSAFLVWSHFHVWFVRGETPLLYESPAMWEHGSLLGQYGRICAADPFALAARWGGNDSGITLPLVSAGRMWPDVNLKTLERSGAINKTFELKTQVERYAAAAFAAAQRAESQVFSLATPLTALGGLASHHTGIVQLASRSTTGVDTSAAAGMRAFHVSVSFFSPLILHSLQFSLSLCVCTASSSSSAPSHDQPELSESTESKTASTSSVAAYALDATARQRTIVQRLRFSVLRHLAVITASGLRLNRPASCLFGSLGDSSGLVHGGFLTQSTNSVLGTGGASSHAHAKPHSNKDDRFCFRVYMCLCGTHPRCMLGFCPVCTDSLLSRNHRTLITVA